MCSRECDFQVRANELSKQPHSKGYIISSITNVISKANAAQRKELLKYKTKPSQIDRIPFFFIYHPDMPKIHKILEQHWPKIESSSKLKRIFPEKPLVAYRRPKSLKDILVRAKLNSLPSQSKHCRVFRSALYITLSYLQNYASFANIQIYAWGYVFYQRHFQFQNNKCCLSNQLQGT